MLQITQGAILIAKTRAELLSEGYREDSAYDFPDIPYTYTASMILVYGGKTVTVTSIIGAYFRIAEDNGRYKWTKGMVKEVVGKNNIKVFANV